MQLFTAATDLLDRSSNTNDDYLYLTKNEFDIFKTFGLIVSIEKGGFLKAPLHNEGGIKLLWPDNNKYLIWTEFEGYEFIMTPKVTLAATTQLHELNEKFKKADSDSFQPYEIPKSITIIDGTNTSINGFDFPRFLVSPGQAQFVVNKFSTMSAYDILEELNQIDNNSR